MEYKLEGVDVLVLSIMVWFLGTWLTAKIRFLKSYSIPPAVTGGLICSLVVTLIYIFCGVEISFDMRIRDLCLLIFFSTIGLSAKFSLLKEGGKALLILLAVATGFLFLQDLTGVLLVKAMGAHPIGVKLSGTLFH